MKIRMTRTVLAAVVAAALIPPQALAWQVSFDGDWQEQTFGLFGGGNDFALRGGALDVVSDGTVSLVWSALPETAWDSTTAAWQWAVEESVPPTDLTRKGGDDRNLAVYFVFLPASDARSVRGAGIRRLLDNEQARVITYVWGGAHERGQMLPSPYLGARGRTVVLRPAGTGSASERVDLAADYGQAFGGQPPSIVGVAVSADSDHTDSEIRARVSDLRLE